MYKKLIGGQFGIIDGRKYADNVSLCIGNLWESSNDGGE